MLEVREQQPKAQASIRHDTVPAHELRDPTSVATNCKLVRWSHVYGHRQLSRRDRLGGEEKNGDGARSRNQG